MSQLRVCQAGAEGEEEESGACADPGKLQLRRKVTEASSLENPPFPLLPAKANTWSLGGTFGAARKAEAVGTSSFSKAGTK